ncbi:hypothetical protein PAXRUDRAFT_28901 [Paxillus rubicundulus Ve08.2h10]|uniref:Uncharacterized protein n=1 Tax=Paxillus rubicundulus Ve08.2h10 TaxID=930991 RepID=A0A0D0D004_9AGAM|nr:hypothetical protein PAXRUDRAFT_28901 [Paxillus rubicundulus Ve08.2h10]
MSYCTHALSVKPRCSNVAWKTFVKVTPLCDCGEVLMVQPQINLPTQTLANSTISSQGTQIWTLKKGDTWWMHICVAATSGISAKPFLHFHPEITGVPTSSMLMKSFRMPISMQWGYYIRKTVTHFISQQMVPLLEALHHEVGATNWTTTCTFGKLLCSLENLALSAPGQDQSTANLIHILFFLSYLSHLASKVTPGATKKEAFSGFCKNTTAAASSLFPKSVSHPLHQEKLIKIGMLMMVPHGLIELPMITRKELNEGKGTPDHKFTSFFLPSCLRLELYSQAPQLPIPCSIYSNWDTAMQKALSCSTPSHTGHGDIAKIFTIADSEVDSTVDHDDISDSEYPFSNSGDVEIPKLAQTKDKGKGKSVMAHTNPKLSKSDDLEIQIIAGRATRRDHTMPRPAVASTSNVFSITSMDLEAGRTAAAQSDTTPCVFTDSDLPLLPVASYLRGDESGMMLPVIGTQTMKPAGLGCIEVPCVHSI